MVVVVGERVVVGRGIVVVGGGAVVVGGRGVVVTVGSGGRIGLMEPVGGGETAPPAALTGSPLSTRVDAMIPLTRTAVMMLSRFMVDVLVSWTPTAGVTVHHARDGRFVPRFAKNLPGSCSRSVRTHRMLWRVGCAAVPLDRTYRGPVNNTSSS
jgi:hypothetical protein